MRGKVILGIYAFFFNFIIPCLGTQRRCHVAWFRTFHSATDTCVVKFAHRDPLPSWLDKLQLEKSLTNASDEQLEALAKDVCSCAFFRVMRSCPASLYELVTALTWRCFPGARGHVMDRLAAAVDRKKQPPSAEDIQGVDGGGDDSDDTSFSSDDEVQPQTKSDLGAQYTGVPETEAEETSTITGTTGQAENEATTSETEVSADLAGQTSTDFSAVSVSETTDGDSSEASALETTENAVDFLSEGGSGAGGVEPDENSKTEPEYDGDKMEGLNPDAKETETKVEADKWQNF